MKRIFICAFLIFGFTLAKSQSCDIPFAKGQQWKGMLKQGTTTKQLSTASFSIDPITNSQYKISDLSAGFFSQFKVDQKLNATISFNCQEVVATGFETPYGPCKIVSGKWDATAKQLTVHWTIEFNEVDETSVFTLK